MDERRPTRAEARTLQIETIKATSRTLLAERGAPALSLREVAREMGIVSSAIYRYFPTRDDLLTALIVDAYNDLGASAERAVARYATEDPRRRLHVAASSIRRWAKRHPNEYALIYGSPVPGYEAPQNTVAPATRVAMVLSHIVSDAWAQASPPFMRPLPSSFDAMFEGDVLRAMMPGVPDVVRARALIVWTSIIGTVSFELYGHYRGSVRSATQYFSLVVDEVADFVLTPSAVRS